MSLNQLSKSSSPYLKQHQHNPVHWFEWSNEAFDRARKENKPIFLSIGYATCHWCHVMAHECFEDQEVADVLNRDFICIKLDREERPDIDHLYMSVCQITTGQGGWPLSVFMNAQKEPFFTGTYFPKYSRNGRPGFLEICDRIQRFWIEKPEIVQDYTDNIRDLLNAEIEQDEDSIDIQEIVHTTYEKLKEQFDKQYAGFGISPKFPSSHNYEFLSSYGKAYNKPEAFFMVEESLKAMRYGGIYDQIGFGIHRYSTDRIWLLPHFEKMLYDQAGLLRAWAKHLPRSKDILVAKTGFEVFEYLERDLKSTYGGFFSAEDADSEGEEGLFYIWKKNELSKLIAAKQLPLICEVFNIKDEGNFKDEATGNQSPFNIPHISRSLSDFAIDNNQHIDSFLQQLDEIRQLLLEYRSQRVRPQRDEKILTDWNAWLITALCDAFKASNEKKFLNSAITTYAFIEKNLSTTSGELLHRVMDKKGGIDGMAPDYLTQALAEISLYEITFDPIYLQKGLQTIEHAINKLWDPIHGGFFYGASTSDLIAKQKDFYDGASPSANSIAFDVLNRLFALTGDIKYRDLSDKLLSAFAPHLKEYPTGHVYFMKCLLENEHQTHIIISTSSINEECTKWVSAIRKHVQIGLSLIVITKETCELLKNIAPYTADLSIPSDEIYAYVCKGHQCERPVNTLNELLNHIG